MKRSNTFMGGIVLALSLATCPGAHVHLAQLKAEGDNEACGALNP